MSPDVDAVTSVWLLRRFHPDFDDAVVDFCPAGKTLHNAVVDSDPDIVHVDTGMGHLDHHQTDADTCAAKLTLAYVTTQFHEMSANQQKGKGIHHHVFPDEALERLIDIVNDIDHFREVYFPNPNADYYDFGLVAQMDGWKLIFPDQHQKMIELGMTALDGIYKTMQNKVWAELEIKKIGVEFESPWGKGIGLETLNDEAVRIAQRMGFTVAVRKDPKKDYVRIKALPGSKADLTVCYNRCREKDPDATWFLHASKKMLLNGSIKNPESRATKLTLREIIEILKKVKS